MKRKIFHECDILDIDTDDVRKILDLVLPLNKGQSTFLFWNPSLFFECFAPFTPFLYTTFPAFYHSTSLSHDWRIKSKDDHQKTKKYELC